MKKSHLSLLLVFTYVVGAYVPCDAKTASGPNDNHIVWEFNSWNDREGWTLPETLNGTVTGGSMWITVHGGRAESGARTWEEQIWGENIRHELASPPDLAIPAERYSKIVIRLINLSPETDGLVRWRNSGQGEGYSGEVRFAMEPDTKQWQEVVCHIDDKWNGMVDQIFIQPAMMWQRGDIWIDRITVTQREKRRLPERPDICSDSAIPAVTIPGISQEDFRDAFNVLDECIIMDVPVRGFGYPTMGPGGKYGNNWWQLDASLNIAGTKWVAQQFTEGMMRGFAQVQAQNPDGRIDLYGGSTLRGQVAEVSSIPRYFEAAYDVARRSGDRQLQELIYATMKKYLGYWFAPHKMDDRCGLVTAVFEETFSNPHKLPGTIAPVDLNVAIAIGCRNASELASYLGYDREADRYRSDFETMVANINKYLWSDLDKVYYNYLVKERKHDERLLCTMFDPMILDIAPPERAAGLIPKLLDPKLFDWGNRPLTTIAKTEPDYVEDEGEYKDDKSWYGDVWTMRNLPVINGLEDAGYHDLAAELAWSTIETFNDNYAEFAVPSTGSGEGVLRYGWTASQYVQAIIEHLFGVDCDMIEKRLRITPHIPKQLQGRELKISNLKLPSGDITMELTVNRDKRGNAVVKISFDGKLPDGHVIEICMPHAGKAHKSVTVNGRPADTASNNGIKNATSISTGPSDNIEVVFRL